MSIERVRWRPEDDVLFSAGHGPQKGRYRYMSPLCFVKIASFFSLFQMCLR